MRSSVVLPQPLGPTMQVNWPCGMFSVTSSRATTGSGRPGKILVRLRISTLSDIDREDIRPAPLCATIAGLLAGGCHGGFVADSRLLGLRPNAPAVGWPGAAR